MFITDGAKGCMGMPESIPSHKDKRTHEKKVNTQKLGIRLTDKTNTRLQHKSALYKIGLSITREEKGGYKSVNF